MKYFSNILFNKNFFKKLNFIFIIISQFYICEVIFSENIESIKKDNTNKEYIDKHKIKSINKNWIKLDKKISSEKNQIIWKKLDTKDFNYLTDHFQTKNTFANKDYSLKSLNRSVVFNDSEIGPDIGWLVPPGFKWNSKYKWDFSARGHSRRKKNESFLGWNGGDAVGQFYFQPLNFEKISFGINVGMRSLYSGSKYIGGGTSIGEGLSLGFRTDKQLSNNSGIALGAEQLLHFDGLTDTGRDIYLTISKGIWSKNLPGNFPLTIGTVGIATGKMAEGNIKFLCSDLFGGAGTEVAHQRSLCVAPVFSLARVFNSQFSTFFEYNSKWFLLGSSFVPIKSQPIRGTFAIQLSDHIDNYKLNNFDELKWVFRLSIGF